MHDIFDRGLVRWVLIAASSRVHLVECKSDFAKAEYAMITLVPPNQVYTPRLCIEQFQSMKIACHLHVGHSLHTFLHTSRAQNVRSQASQVVLSALRCQVVRLSRAGL